MKSNVSMLLVFFLSVIICIATNSCKNSGKKVTIIPHPNIGNCDPCTNFACSTVAVLCYTPNLANPVSLIYKDADGNNAADLMITNKSSTDSCLVEIDSDHPYLTITGNSSFKLAPYGDPNNSKFFKILINKNWDGSKCNGIPCIFDSLQIRSRWDNIDTVEEFNEDHVLFQWNKPVTISTFWIPDDGGKNSYHGTIGQYPDPNISTPITYFYNHIYAITNPNIFGIWIQVNNPPDNNGNLLGCLANNITFDPTTDPTSGNWTYIPMNGSFSFGNAISSNFKPVAGSAGRTGSQSVECLTNTAATAIIYSENPSFTDPSSKQKWIQLQLKTQ